MTRWISNFGRNVCFRPAHYYAPTTEAEVLDLLDKHASGKVRAVGALHSWSEAVVTDGAVLDLRHFRHIQVDGDPAGEVYITAGAGCKVKDLLAALERTPNATLPTLGLITEQTIAGAISTGTHGSGKPSLSHFVQELRVAAYDLETKRARIYVWDAGNELKAARCALGCMGIILSVRLRCAPKYDVAETVIPCATLKEVLALEPNFPLQQFFLMPHRWSYIVQARRPIVPKSPPGRTWSALVYRVYWFLWIDIALHLVVKFLASVARGKFLIRWFYRYVIGTLIVKNCTVTDRSDRMLVMEHELFRHFEMEIFVPASMLERAARFVQAVLAFAAGDGRAPPDTVMTELRSVDLDQEFFRLEGTYCHHYPLTFRRVLPDETLISMTSGSDEPYYAISLITYAGQRQPFCRVASFLAAAMAELFKARLHWGKYFPLSSRETEKAYPALAAFRRICQEVDPHGVFRNAYAERVLGFEDRKKA